MANNRIYIRCQGCGDTLFIGKTLSEGYWYESYNGIPLETKINEFYEKHNYCFGAKPETVPYDEDGFPLPAGMCGKDGAFDIVYEIKD